MRAVILIHGFWHRSWCWSRVTEQLASRGIPPVAVDLELLAGEQGREVLRGVVQISLDRQARAEVRRQPDCYARLIMPAGSGGKRGQES
jgi:hypothetical protein